MGRIRRTFIAKEASAGKEVLETEEVNIKFLNKNKKSLKKEAQKTEEIKPFYVEWNNWNINSCRRQNGL